MERAGTATGALEGGESFEELEVHPLGEGDRLVVVGGGMAAHQFLEKLVARADPLPCEVEVISEEPIPPYDRVHLTSVLRGAAPASLSNVVFDVLQ